MDSYNSSSQDGTCRLTFLVHGPCTAKSKITRSLMLLALSSHIKNHDVAFISPLIFMDTLGCSPHLFQVQLYFTYLIKPYYISSSWHHAINNDCPSWAPHPYLPRHLILWKEHASASRTLISSATASTLSSKASVGTNGQWQAASPHLDVPGSAGKWLVNGAYHLYLKICWGYTRLTSLLRIS